MIGNLIFNFKKEIDGTCIMHVSHPCHFVTSYYISALKITIGSSVSVRSSRYEARGKFGEHERCVRVARTVAESNSNFLSALQTSIVS